MAGMYLAIEGPDGAGKSTVATMVAKAIEEQGFEVVHVREPGSTSLGEGIRQLLLHGEEMTPWAEAMLFAAQRAQLTAEIVKPALAEGKWVVTDRSYYSSLAYQGGARNLGVDSVREVNEAGLEGVIPDIVVILDIEPSAALDRQREPDRIGAESDTFHANVVAAYRTLAQADPERVKLIDANASPDEVVRSVVAAIGLL